MLIHSQTNFDFKLEIKKRQASVTSFGGIPLLRLALRKLGLIDEMKKFLKKKAGYADPIILAGSPKKLTLDLDGTLIETHKREALYSFEGTKAYQPMTVFCPELSLVIAHEFRDGNVSPGEGFQRMVERCKKILPKVHFTVRADSAAYQNDFLEWMTKNKIRYYITARLAGGTREWLAGERDWKPLIMDDINTGQEIVDFMYPISFKNRLELKWRSRTRRYIATRKEKDQPDLLFGRYMYQVIVTNALWETKEQSLKNHRGRCGTVEYSHSQLKSQCGMSIMPSNDFKVNAAWFSLGCLTHNLLRLLQNHVLTKAWKKLEIQTLRFRFLRTAALVITKAKKVILRFSHNHPIYEIYHKARLRLQELPI